MWRSAPTTAGPHPAVTTRYSPAKSAIWRRSLASCSSRENDRMKSVSDMADLPRADAHDVRLD